MDHTILADSDFELLPRIVDILKKVSLAGNALLKTDQAIDKEYVTEIEKGCSTVIELLEMFISFYKVHINAREGSKWMH